MHLDIKGQLHGMQHSVGPGMRPCMGKGESGLRWNWSCSCSHGKFTRIKLGASQKDRHGIVDHAESFVNFTGFFVGSTEPPSPIRGL